MRSVPVFDEQGELIAYEGILRDVTEHVNALEERERNVELLRYADAERGRLLNRLVHAQEEERRLIAQDLHDDSIQVLTALAMRLELLTDAVDDPSVVTQLTEATRTARSVITGLRGLLFELDPPVLRREGLAAALAEQLDLIHQQTGADVRLESTLTAEPPFETAATAYRIAQEALVNARKHAQATLLTVQVDGDEEGLTVCVADDGCGFELRPEQLGHLGLVSMRERAEMASGWWRIHSTPGSGTTVEFHLPLRPGGAAQRERRGMSPTSVIVVEDQPDLVRALGERSRPDPPLRLVGSADSVERGLGSPRSTGPTSPSSTSRCRAAAGRASATRCGRAGRTRASRPVGLEVAPPCSRCCGPGGHPPRQGNRGQSEILTAVERAARGHRRCPIRSPPTWSASWRSISSRGGPPSTRSMR